MAEIPMAAIAQVADYFKVLSDQSRLQMLCVLKEREQNVTEIVAATGLKQANVSKHLKILTQAGIIQREPQGVSVYYRLSDPMIFELCDLVCQRLETQLATQSQQLSDLQKLRQP